MGHVHLSLNGQLGGRADVQCRNALGVAPSRQSLLLHIPPSLVPRQVELLEILRKRVLRQRNVALALELET